MNTETDDTAGPMDPKQCRSQCLVARIQRDQWKAEAERWRDMYMQFDEMLESDIKDATKKVSDIIAQVEKLSKEIDKGY
jgi:hypothetical protein